MIKNTITELCISGGSQRGICYLGALSKLEKLGYLKKENLKKVIGVSIGSFVLAVYLLNDSVNDILKMVINSNISSFADLKITNISLLNSDNFRNWVHDNIGEITLNEFYEKTKVHFIIVQSCLEDGLIYMDYTTHPNVKLYEALIASMSLPFIFEPYIINDKKYVDGGVLDNFPLYKLGPDSYGIKMKSNKNKENNDIVTTIDYMKKLFELVHNHINQYKKPISKNIIEIDTSDFNHTDFMINIDEKITLFKRGEEAVSKFFENEVVNEVVNEVIDEVIDEVVLDDKKLKKDEFLIKEQ